MKKYVIRVLLMVFAAVFMLSCFMIGREIIIRRQSAAYVLQLRDKFSPEHKTDVDVNKSEDPEETDNTDKDTNEVPDRGNPAIQALVEEYPDAVGWLTVPGAEVDHPFVIGEDNAQYIRAGLDGEYLISGSLFMDFRNSRDLNDGISVIYGHNMKDKTMFAKLTNYADAQYIIDNPDVYVYLPEETRHYKVYAYMIDDAYESLVFNSFGRRDDIGDIADYITEHAEYINKDVKIDGESKILVLSTCNPVYFTARALLICVLD